MTEHKVKNSGNNPKMERFMVWTFAALLIAGIVFSFTFSGCAPQQVSNADTAAPAAAESPAQAAPTGSTPPGGEAAPGRQGNMTEEQRQAMMEERLKQETASCSGLAEGASCTLASPRGNMTGSCVSQDSALLCRLELGERPSGDMPAPDGVPQ